MLSRLRYVADRMLDLAEQARDDLPEQQADQSCEQDVVRQCAKRARDAVEREPVDAGSHRRGEHEAQEEKCDQDLELPKHDEPNQGQHSHRGDNQRRSRKASLLRHRSNRAVGWALIGDSPRRRRRNDVVACPSSSVG